MKKGLKKQIALLLSAMMIFSTSASAFPAMAEDNLIFEKAENNTINSDYEFYNSESEITVTTCENKENPTKTEITTVSTTNEVSVQYSEEQTENNPVEVYNSDYAVYADSDVPEGDGSESNPYKISNSSQLFWFAEQVNSGNTSINVILTADIVVNNNLLDSLKFDENGNVTNEENFEKWTPIGNSSKQHKGIFDGQNHTISGLYFNNSTNYVGLFGYNFGTIKNVGIIDSYFKGGVYVGGVCGYNSGTIENSYNTSLIISASGWVGGVCGVNHTNSTITNSYNTGSVSSSSVLIGGFCGNNSGTIENSYNIGIVNGKNYVGGFCGNNSGTITKSYYLETCNAEGTKFDCNGGITKTFEQFASGEVAYLLQKEQGTEIWGQEIDIDNFPVLNGKKVYENKTCSGCSEKYQGDVIKSEYSNAQADTIYLGNHNFENGICTNCGTYELIEPTEKNGYYQIENANHLYWFAEQVNNERLDINAVLTADIVVNNNLLNSLKFDENGNVTNEENFEKWTPIGNFFNQYAGIFDGNNHTISGLYFNDENNSAGLFGWNYGTIKNIGIVDSYFKGGSYVGSVCGGGNNGIIENSYNTSLIISASGWVGGICGYNNEKVTNCHNAGTVSGSDLYVGGICGENLSTIENSYNTGSVSGSEKVGGICGLNYSLIENSYNTGSVSGSNLYVGGICGLNSGGIIESNYNIGSVSSSMFLDGGICALNQNGMITNCYYNNSVYSGEAVGYNDNGTVTEVSGKTSEQFASGEVAYLLGEIWGQKIGTDSLPVFNGEKVYANKTCSGCCEKYQGDITKCEYSNTEADTIYLGNHNFENGICTGCGTYEPIEPDLKDGYYQIGNANHLYWFAKQVNSGNTKINAILTANIVVNTNVLNADGTLNSDSALTEWTPIGISSNRYTGTFDGNDHTISGLYFNNENTDYVGLFGYNNSSTIKNVGIIDSYFKGGSYVGGVCGFNKGTIEKSYNTGSVSGESSVGGVCGDNSGTIENSYNTGSVNGASSVGGVCGGNSRSGKIKNSYNTGSVSKSGSVGGVCGRNESKIENSYNAGSVSGASYSIGGVCGYNNGGEITKSYNTGSVSGSSYSIGGVCGYNNGGEITKSYNTGSVSGSSTVGGICGENSGIIRNSYNTGSVSGSSSSVGNVGGVCGQSKGTIENSYNTGSVSGAGNSIGGVCGHNWNSGTIKNSYNTGTVSGSAEVGGVCGYNWNGTIENSYYNNSVYSGKDIGVNDNGTVNKVSGKTSEQFASGEVAYLLGEIWGQEIGKDKLPVLNSENKVYKVTAYSSVGNEIISEIYTNKSVTVTAPIKEGYNFKGWYTYDENNDNHYTGDILCSSREYNNLNVTADSKIVAVYEPLGTANITINCDREYTINGISKSSATTENYLIGSTITLSCSDENFAYWQNNAGTILSRENEYSFVVTGDETISAVFNEVVENKATLIFESFYGQVITTEQLGSGEKIDNPDLPVRTGYNALGWDFDGDGKFTENDTLENAIEIGLRLDSKTVKIVPVYELINETYNITVENGKGSGEYKQNDIVTATPNKAETGMKFSHWEDSDGNVLSYNEKYVFYVSKDMTVKAIYVETETKVDAKGTTGIVEFSKTTNNKLSFVSMSTVPEGCKINKAGIIATDDSTIGKSDNFTDKNAKFVRGMSSDKKAVRYTWTKGNVKSGQTWYVRAYLVYTDSNGNVHTVYGDMVSQTY